MIRIHTLKDMDLLRTGFDQNRRVLLRNALTGEAAERLSHCLVNEAEWSIVFVEAGNMLELPARLRGSDSEEKEKALLKRSYEASRNGFSYFQEANPRSVSDGSSGRPHRQLDRPLQQFMKSMNSDRTLRLFRDLTGYKRLVRVGVQTSKFRKGHYLARHDDSLQENRKVAYVLNLTRYWEVDWGGHLQFLSPNGDVLESYVPIFNSMALFEVPQWHAVSMVAPFAQADRYAISGWMYTG